MRRAAGASIAVLLVLALYLPLQEVKAGTTAPTGTLEINGGDEYTNSPSLTLTLTCTDDASGCDTITVTRTVPEYNTNPAVAETIAVIIVTSDTDPEGESFVPVETGVDTGEFAAVITLGSDAGELGFTDGDTITVTNVIMGTSEGVKVVRAVFTDAANNSSTEITDSITLDTLPPDAPEIDSPVNGTITNENAPTIEGTLPATHLLTWGSFGTGDGQFKSPIGVAVDYSDNVYVVDQSNHRVQKFDSSGNFITKWGTAGSGNGQFETPVDVAIDSSENVYVADFDNNRIQKFDEDGNFITAWGSAGTGNGQFDRPLGIAVDAAGNVYVADYGNDRIQMFNGAGTFITKWGSTGTEDGQFQTPEAMAVNSLGQVYVSDHYNHRMQKFEPPSDSTVEVFDGLTSLDTLATDGTWSITPSPLADGAHSITATVTDAAGNESPASSAVDIMIDTVTPDAPEITSPSSGATNEIPAEISGSSEENISIEVFDSSDLLGETTADEAGDWSLELPFINNTVLAKMPAEDFSNVGSGVASGDINGDGLDDVIAKADFGDAGDGEVQVYLTDPGSEDTTVDFILTSNENDAGFGWSIATGDVNNDGFDDVIVGVVSADNGATDNGEVRIFYGSSEFDDTADVILTKTPAEAGAGFGISVTSADLNDDGFDDVIVGSEADNGASGNGEVQVFFGSPGSFDTTADAIFTKTPAESLARFGNPVSFADANNDGIDDLLVSAQFANNGASDAGEVHVFYGGSAFDTTVDAILTKTPVEASAKFGTSLASGDVNDDGFDDIIVGSPNADSGSSLTNRGQVRIFLGSSGALDTTSDAVLDGTWNVGRFAGSVASGDYNNDGVDDIIVGASQVPNGAQNNGEVLIFLGGPGSFDTTADEVLTKTPAEINAYFGQAVASANISDDGYIDLIVGAYQADNGGSDTGEVHLFVSSTLDEGFHILTAQATDNAGNESPLSDAVNITIDTTSPAAPVITTSPGLTNDNTLFIEGIAPPNFVSKWGSTGTNNGTGTANEFYYPAGIAVDSLGNVYVADTGYDRVQKFSNSGDFVEIIGSFGFDDGEFVSPYGIVFDSEDNMYVADSAERVQKFDSSGDFIMSWASTGSYGTGIAVDSSDNIFVIGYNMVQKFDSDGNLLTGWGSLGSGEGEFETPFDVAVDSEDNVYVVDAGNNRVQKFDNDGGFITTWGTLGDAEGNLDFPSGIDVDSSDYVYVADYFNSRIQKFDSDGNFIMSWGSYGEGDGQFCRASNVAIGPDGYLYAVGADGGECGFENDRVQKFEVNTGEYSVEVFANGGSLGTATMEASGIWSFTTPALSDGLRIITAQATDTVGNVSPVSEDYVFVIDTTGTITIRVVDGEEFLPGASFTITPNPFDGEGELEMTDNDEADSDDDVGIILLEDAIAETYTVEESIQPEGYESLIEQATVTVHDTDPNPVATFEHRLEGETIEEPTEVPPPNLSEEQFDSFTENGATVNGEEIDSTNDLPPGYFVPEDQEEDIGQDKPVDPATVEFEDPAPAGSTAEELFEEYSIPTYPAPDEDIAADIIYAVPAFVVPQEGFEDNSFVLTPIIEEIFEGMGLVLDQNQPVDSGNAQLVQVSMEFAQGGENIGFSFGITDTLPAGFESPPQLDKVALFLDVDFIGNVDFSNPDAFTQSPEVTILAKRLLETDDSELLQRFEDGCPALQLYLLDEETGLWEELDEPVRFEEIDTPDLCGYIVKTGHFSKFGVGGVRGGVITVEGSGGGGGGAAAVLTYSEAYFEQNPLQKIEIASNRIVDSAGNIVSTVSEGEQVTITGSVKNRQKSSQDFAFIVQVIDEHGYTMHLGWLVNNIGSGKSTTLSQSWSAAESGTYRIQIFVWDGIDSPAQLAAPTAKSLKVV